MFSKLWRRRKGVFIVGGPQLELVCVCGGGTDGWGDGGDGLAVM